jgi:integrase
MPRAHSRLFRRPRSPYWYAVWTDHAGAVHRQSTGCRDHAAAAAWLATRELERVKEGAGIPVARPVSLLQATGEYLAEREPEWSPKWWGTVEGFVGRRVVPHFGEGRIVATIQRDDVARFRGSEIGRPGRGGQPIKGATVNRLMWALAAFGGWCVEHRYHTSNPWARHDALPEDQLPPPAVDGETLTKIVAAVEADPQVRFPWRALFALAAETGLRKGELGRLAWQDVDRDERRAWVVSSHARGHNKGRRLRSIALSGAAMRILDAPWVRRADGLVFGSVPDPRRAFARAATAAGLDRVWLHLMRHTAATAVGRAGASLSDLMGFGGWASIRMAQRYSHTDHRRQREIVDRAFPGPTRDPPDNTGGQPES